LQVGCAGHDVKYVAFVKQRMTPTDHAVSISGTFDEAKTYFEKAQLPHNTPRQKYELMLEGLENLTAQLGSHDYVLIGEVFGGGNAWASQETLTQAFCTKAARRGGDVVMIFRRATVEQPYVYTTPGYSTTNANVSAYGYGNYATAYGTSHTMYTPGQTYAGVRYKPQANGLVFKHVPGADAERQRLLSADDESLAKAIRALEELGNNSKVSWEEARSRCRSIVQAATGQTLGDGARLAK
jgi:hypothetical protein